jgi:hypothetical protein
MTPTPADAHPLSTTAILLDAAPEKVTGKVELPIDRLAIALDQPLTAKSVVQAAKLEELRRYVLGHTSAADPDGTPWTTTVSGGRVEKIDGVDHLVFDLVLRPANGTVHDFRLTYDAIVHHLLSHQILVSLRPSGSDDYTTVGVLDWQQHTIAIPAAGASTEHGFVAAVHLGIQHIASGADHLLFLVMLLLPAPLLARRGRWVRADDLRRNSWRVVHVVTAFAVGHSITLALAALGYISAPTRVVESLIALSILVSGIHAVRPLVPGGETWIAAGFGLMHGLAFATRNRTDPTHGRRSAHAVAAAPQPNPDLPDRTPHRRGHRHRAGLGVARRTHHPAPEQSAQPRLRRAHRPSLPHRWSPRGRGGGQLVRTRPAHGQDLRGR